MPQVQGGDCRTLRKETAAARTAGKKSRADADDEEDEEDEERPARKKKKKKSKSNRGLLIGGGIAALVLIVVVVVIIMLSSGGSAKDKVAQKKVEAPPPPPPPVAKVPEEPVIPRKAPATAIARRMESTHAQNMLRQLGVAYQQFETVNGRGFKDQKEINDYLKSNEIKEALQNTWITFIWGATRQSLNEYGSSNTILAYETDADTQGNRYAVMGDGSVQIFDDGTFQKTPKAKGK